MVQFKVGDVVTLCASIRDWCFYTSYYEIFDINISTGTCAINYTSLGCLSPSGIQLDFQWTNTRSSTPTHSCSSASNIKFLGSANTNAQGIASTTYTITQDDLDLFNANATFDLRVCIRGTPYVNSLMIGKTRNEINFRFGDYIEIVQDPCTGIICDNACVGLDLYSQRCVDGACITDTLIESNSPLCGAVQEKHYLYFKVPELYPISYVISSMGLIFQVAAHTIGAYTDYYIEAVDFDQAKYIVTITITKTLGLGLGANKRIRTMPLFLIPIAYYLAIAAGIIAAALSVLILEYIGSKSVVGEPVSTRTITISPKICVGNADTGVPDCTNPAPPMIISIEHCFGDACDNVEIADGSPITLTAPTDVGITITAKVKGNPYYTEIKKAIDKGITDENVTLEFMAKADATITPEIVDDTTGSPITGTYFIREETADGLDVEVQRGNLDANGKISPPFVAKAGVKTCITIIPYDIDVHLPTTECITPAAGDDLSPIFSMKRCLEAKNHISVRTVYIGSNGDRFGYKASSIEIKVGSNIVNTVTPTTDITYIEGLDKNITYTVHVIKADYTILNNDQTVSFTTDCGTTTALIVESNPPAGTRDITIEVRNATTSVAIEGANVTLDTMPTKKTGPSGTVTLTAIPDGDHDLKITLDSYKDNDSTINVSSSSTTFTKTLTVEHVEATVDTRIYEFTNIGDAIATKPIKFGGKLEYLSGTEYNALTDATITVTIRDTTNSVLQTFTSITRNGLTELGVFETGEWVIPDGMTDAQINVDATFDGVGSYKPSSSSTSYAVAAADACVIPLPWGGCLLSKEAGTGLLLLGAMAIGGIVLLSSGAKSLTGGTTKIIEERPIPPHYRPENLPGEEHTPRTGEKPK